MAGDGTSMASTSSSSSQGWETDASGYIWRKYGEKTVGVRKHAVKRAYFRCMCHKAQDPCPAKKRVDRLVSGTPDDPPLSVSYIGKHNHSPKVSSDNQSPSAAGDRAVSARSGADQLQRTGFEKMKPEEMAREMYKDIMVNMAEAAAVNSMDPCAPVHLCCHRCTDTCTNIDGSAEMPSSTASGLGMPLAIELPDEILWEDNSDAFSTEADEITAPASPCSTLSPLSTMPSTAPLSPPAHYAGGDFSAMRPDAADMSNQGTKPHTPPQPNINEDRDVKSLVEKLQQEIRARRSQATGQKWADGVTNERQEDAPRGKGSAADCCNPDEDLQLSADMLLDFPALHMTELQEELFFDEPQGLATLLQ